VAHELKSGAPAVTWYHEPETFTPIAKVEGERRFSVLGDQLGTPTAMYDEAGRLAWQMQLDAYGVPREEAGAGAQAGTNCPWRWPGQYTDAETGLYYNGFRYYDPEAGTYISPDPIGIEGGFEPYGYVADPLVWLDPLGLAACRKDIEKLLTGPMGTTVVVASKRDADELLKAAFPGFQKIAGFGGQVASPSRRKHLLDRWKRGRAFHKDYAIDPATGRAVGHKAGPSWHDGPHIDINRGTLGRKDVVHILVRTR